MKSATAFVTLLLAAAPDAEYPVAWRSRRTASRATKPTFAGRQFFPRSNRFLYYIGSCN